jgi:ABC-type long-subunit fatty acid transport system fused permease/ATPase subunit
VAGRLADSIPDKRGRSGIQAGGSVFQSFYLSQRWLPWAFPGAALILSVTWCKVELDVKINDWFGDFYNLIQKALSRTNTITMDEYMGCWPHSAISRASM